MKNNEINDAEFEKLVNKMISLYRNDLRGIKTEITAEIELWKNELPEGNIHVINMLTKINLSFYSNVYNLLKLFYTIPLLNATTEGSFSSLKFLKTFLRGATTENVQID